MPALSEVAKAMLEQRGKAHTAEIIERMFDEISALQEDRVHWGDPKTLTPDERSQRGARVLLQASVHRMTRLLRSVGGVIEQHDPYGLSLVTRGALETTCQIGFFCERLNALEKKSIDRDNFNDKLSSALVGTKTLATGERDVKPINVMSYVEKADKFYSGYVNAKEPPAGFLRKGYDDLSEICHPNFSSSASSFSIDAESHDFVFKHEDELDDVNLNNVHMVAVTAVCFVSFIREYSKRLHLLD